MSAGVSRSNEINLKKEGMFPGVLKSLTDNRLVVSHGFIPVGGEISEIKSIPYFCVFAKVSANFDIYSNLINSFFQCDDA